MNRIRLAGTSLLVTLTTVAALTGCTTQAATPVESAPAGDNRPTATATQVADAGLSTSTSEAPATQKPAADGTSEFGKAYTWEDGLSVTVSAPKAYTPSSSAFGPVAGQKAVSFQITIVNGTSAPFDPVMASITAQSGNTEASQIFDSAKAMEGSPSTKILAGRETTYKVAFSVADASDIVVEFSPDFTHESVLFAS
ncbi:hypothetical protein GA0111570_10272 [Raineyella antarctica]|uniref:DUF4352 domain-containing protein n=1 Tax=Raineyella antarctica TaxID=1577474 RepID=A0A1G6GGH5_9ACTN|nr:hypothetical protein [Raineyella antarctica]SDB80286.1 hypothetical protein GA0111570_10272 [Raineyella antarctica]